MCSEIMINLSVIVTVYKTEKYLKKCLESLINQELKSIEIIIIDDGSPDNSALICDQIADQDKRVRVVHQDNMGICGARNTGISIAQGKYVTFVDSDDWCALDYYSSTFTFLERYTDEPDVLITNHYKNNNKSIPLFTKEFITYDQRLIHKCKTGALAIIHRPIINDVLVFPWDKLYRRKFLEENKILFNQNIKAHEDVLFNMYVFNKAKSIGFNETYGYHYRILENSTSNQYNPHWLEYDNIILDILYEHKTNNDSSDEMMNAIYWFTIILYINRLSKYFFNQKRKIILKKKCIELKYRMNEPYYKVAFEKIPMNLLTKKQKAIVWLAKMNLPYLTYLCFRCAQLFSGINILKR